MTKYRILLIAILLFSSCNNDQTKHSDVPLIDLEGLWDSDGFVKLSEVAESVEYIALKKTNICILPGGYMILAKRQDEYIIIYTPKQPIYIFNKSGKFLFTLANYGQGPGEFLAAQVEFDASNKLFWILDPSQKKLLKFDKSGVFMDEFKLSSDAKRMAIRSDGQLYVLILPFRLHPELAEVQELNVEGQIVDRIPLYQNREPGAGDYASITAFFGLINDTLYFNEGPYRYGYYLSKKNKWEEAWKMYQGKNSLPDEAYYGTSEPSFTTGPAVISTIETSQYLFMCGQKEGLQKRFVHFKDQDITKSNHILAETIDQMDIYGLFNDVDGGLPFWPSRYSGSDLLVQVNDAQRYIDIANGHLKYYGTEQTAPLSSKLRAFCKKLDPEDNPVVMVVKLK